MKNLLNKNIVLGVTGGIAAYKSADLVRKLQQAGASVRVVMTRAAEQFIGALTMQALSQNPVHVDLLDEKAEAAMGHIELARWADAVLIAPCSADFIAKMTSGSAGDLLSALILATRAPVMIAPAMNSQMWHAAATVANIQCLQNRGVLVLEPDSGALACGEVGAGRMPEPTAITRALAGVFVDDLLAGKKVLISAGATQEAIDPVRFISNHSSGKMGFAIAQGAAELGAAVTLVAGAVHLPTPPKVTRVDVKSALQMYQAIVPIAPEFDIFIATAAVADYRVENIAASKIKKSSDSLTLTLTKNPDILAAVAKERIGTRPFCVGFAAETDRVQEYALGKLQSKNIDLICANKVDGSNNTGFNADNNEVCAYWFENQKPHQQFFANMPKRQLGRELCALIAQLSK